MGRLAVVVALLFAGCATPLRAEIAPSFGRLQELRAQELRVASVAYRLSVAGRALCRGAMAGQPGFTMHGIEQYDVADRPVVAAGFALGRHAGVMAVVAGSPADRAGLKADDQLVSVNGRVLSLAAADPGNRPTRAAVEQSEKIVSEEMKTGEVTIRVLRAGGLRDVRFVPELGCVTKVELVPGRQVNAWADGDRVVISAGIVEQCGTDADLALVIAHEIAHNLLGHSHKLARASGRSEVMRLRGSGAAAMRQTEEEADRLAVVLASAASYDLARAEAFMARLLENPDGANAAETHPAADRRLKLLGAAIAAARRPSPELPAR
ncbi:MAG TPA: M48 family metalloprotease [Sphingomonadaceae bacterium]|nr:M48 family metalloprotease [Sphingomonadaceae bacterium]